MVTMTMSTMVIVAMSTSRMNMAISTMECPAVLVWHGNVTHDFYGNVKDDGKIVDIKINWKFTLKQNKLALLCRF